MFLFCTYIYSSQQMLTDVPSNTRFARDSWGIYVSVRCVTWWYWVLYFCAMNLTWPAKCFLLFPFSWFVKMVRLFPPIQIFFPHLHKKENIYLLASQLSFLIISNSPKCSHTARNSLTKTLHFPNQLPIPEFNRPVKSKNTALHNCYPPWLF